MPRIPSIKVKTTKTADGRGRTYLDYRVDGRRYRETIGPATSAMKSLANQIAAERITEIVSGRFRAEPECPRVSFKDFAKEYLTVHVAKLKSERRVKVIVANLRERFGDRLVADITTLDVERYQTRRRQDVMPATVNRELAILKNLFNKAIAWGKAGTNPVRGVRFLKENNARVRYLSEEEATRLEAACSPHLRPIVVLARHTGMRQGEIVGLKWNQVDSATSYARVTEAKSGEGREVPLNATAREVLRNLPRGIRGEHVFLKPDGAPVTCGWIYLSFKKACDDAKVENFHFHDLRHDCASRLVMAGRSLEEVRRVLGHKTLVMTARYSHLSPDHLHKVVSSLDAKVERKTDTQALGTVAK